MSKAKIKELHTQSLCDNWGRIIVKIKWKKMGKKKLHKHKLKIERNKRKENK
ncbi:hypothetical protein [Spiroplasma endosymbiont of Polydrusus pterygomalis]|uniref:hypothetical protein n=1 Tax=Spiroplasma endosymbiont of Polydrusus pterygomalis TaxID=3139327 RepID=UPI003CCB008E